MPDPILTALTASITQKRPVALATVVAATGKWVASVGRKAIVWLDQEATGTLGLADLDVRVLADARDALVYKYHKLLRYEIEGEILEVFVEVQRRPPTLLIVGAGHIAVPLAQLGSLCAFSVTVLDDRTQYATRERFPTADRVIAAHPELDATTLNLSTAYGELSIGVKHGLRTIALGSLRKDGTSPHWHKASDTLENVDGAVLERSLELAWQLLRGIDASVG